MEDHGQAIGRILCGPVCHIYYLKRSKEQYVWERRWEELPKGFLNALLSGEGVGGPPCLESTELLGGLGAKAIRASLE